MPPSVVRFFLCRLGRELREFTKAKIIFALTLIGAALLYSSLHFPGHSLKENLLERIVPFVGTTCAFALWYVGKTTVSVWEELRGAPQKKPIIILTDLDRRTKTPAFRAHLLGISGLFTVVLISLPVALGWVARRTAVPPTESELAEFGFGGTVDVVVRRSWGQPTQPQTRDVAHPPASTTYVEPIATGILVSRAAGYVVTCSPEISSEWAERNLFVEFPGPSRLSGNSLVASAVMSVQAHVARRDEDTGLALLALEGNPFNPNSLTVVIPDVPRRRLSVPHLPGR